MNQIGQLKAAGYLIRSTCSFWFTCPEIRHPLREIENVGWTFLIHCIASRTA